MLYDLKRKAQALEVKMEVVTGSAAAWDNPWSCARRCHVAPSRSEYDFVLYDEQGVPIDDRDVQLARVAATIH